MIPLDPENKVIKRCAEGMLLEGKGQPAAARQLFEQAWEEARTDLEQCIAAHYVARHQPDAGQKLAWDRAALGHALRAGREQMRPMLPSLYLNLGKCYEDLGDRFRAEEHYGLAQSCTQFLPDDGYGELLRKAIRAGLERVGR